MTVPTKLSIALSILAVAGLAGCGSDDHAPKGASGKLTQGPVVGAVIYADNVSGGVRFTKESGEVSTTTDTNGNFTLPSIPGYNHILVSTGGEDKLTGKPAIQMIAPSGAANITPLTTLVALDTTGLVKAKIEALGASYDTDISLNATPALLNLSKSIELVIESLTAAITAASVSVSPEQHAAVQTQAMQSIATSFSTTTEDLAKPASLNAAMTTAVNAAVVNINLKNSNISIPSGQGATIATNSVTAATTAVLGASEVGSTNAAAISGTTVESSVITSAAITAMTQAINSTVTTIGTLVVTATPANYVAPSLPVSTVVTVAPTGSTGGTGGNGSF